VASNPLEETLMRVLFACCLLLGLSATFDGPVVSVAEAAAKCSYQACMQRCVANRGRFCSENCRRCE
jgi:hypothetical protein